MKKQLSLLLASLLLLTSLASCASDQEEAAAESGTSGSTEAGAEAEEAAFDPDDTSVDGRTHYSDMIEAVDLNGWLLRIARNSDAREGYNYATEEMNGEILNDSIYERNARISDKYNMTFEEVISDSTAQLKGCVSAGSNDIGFAAILQKGAASLVSNRFLRPVSSMPHIDLTKPYWDQGSQKTLSFNGVIYYGLSDIAINHYESMSTIFYNGKLINDFNLDDPYELFMNDAWTIDAMRGMMETVSSDLNGNGSRNIREDCFGFAGRNFENLPWLYASDSGLFEYDETEGAYLLRIGSEKNIRIGEAVALLINNKDICYPNNDDPARNAFMAGNVLFYGHQLNEFRNLRTVDDDYGIICFPGVNGSREECGVYVQNPYSIMIPITNVGEYGDMLGMILEAWSADSYDYLIPNYYQYAVIGKGARDPNSAEMLKYMREHRAYDLSYVTSVDASITGWNFAITKGRFSSVDAQYSKVANKNIAKSIEALSYDVMEELE